MIKNPWIILGAVIILIATHSYAWINGDTNGYDRYELEQKEVEDKAEEEAVKNVEKVKKETRVVYKYIQEQNNDCDIYDNVIERLRGPQGNSR